MFRKKCFIIESKAVQTRGNMEMKRSETIGYKMRLIHNQVHKMMEAKRKENEGDLTPMQCWTIEFLKEHEGQEMYQRDIETAFSVSRATASNMLSVMERKGLIERHSVEHDARLKKLVLTEKSKEMIERAERDVSGMEEMLTRGMSDAEILCLKKSLNRILSNLGVDQETTTRCCGSCGRANQKKITGKRQKNVQNE